MVIAKSLLFFFAAGLCEIGGGYLMWLWLREGKSLWYALGGAVVLVFYGVIPTFQAANFGRVYGAYGGVFLALSLLWRCALIRLLLTGSTSLAGWWPCSESLLSCMPREIETI
jgi:small multidrug resistance family-3 protein